MRIDKWLWATRIFKTRTLAANACRDGEVTIGGQRVKPSREVKSGDLIVAEKAGIRCTLKALGFPEQRVGAQAVATFLEDLTPASEYEKHREPVLEPLFYRPKGAGRPTKKDRRALGKIDRMI